MPCEVSGMHLVIEPMHPGDYCRYDLVALQPKAQEQSYGEEKTESEKCEASRGRDVPRVEDIQGHFRQRGDKDPCRQDRRIDQGGCKRLVDEPCNGSRVH